MDPEWIRSFSQRYGSLNLLCHFLRFEFSCGLSGKPRLKSPSQGKGRRGILSSLEWTRENSSLHAIGWWKGAHENFLNINLGYIANFARPNFPKFSRLLNRKIIFSMTNVSFDLHKLIFSVWFFGCSLAKFRPISSSKIFFYKFANFRFFANFSRPVFSKHLKLADGCCTAKSTLELQIFLYLQSCFWQKWLFDTVMSICKISPNIVHRNYFTLKSFVETFTGIVFAFSGPTVI